MGVLWVVLCVMSFMVGGFLGFLTGAVLGVEAGQKSAKN